MARVRAPFAPMLVRVTNYAWSPIRVADEDEVSDEPLGTKQKFWVMNPDDGSEWLFKFARVTRGRQMGEDWAEWVAHHIALALGVPCATIRPAECGGRRGIVSKKVMDSQSGQRLVHGNSILSDRDPDYDGTLSRTNSRYTVPAVAAALEGVVAPPGWGLDQLTGFEVWAGYLVLDALIAGRDRHHENWGVVSDGSIRHLAPTYDHGNALGFQESEDAVVLLNASPERRARWLARGKSHHFADRPSLVEVALQALSLSGEVARVHWRERVETLSVNQLRSMTDAVPPHIMSEAARTFATNVVLENRRRLTDALDSC